MVRIDYPVKKYSRAYIITAILGVAVASTAPVSGAVPGSPTGSTVNVDSFGSAPDGKDIGIYLTRAERKIRRNDFNGALAEYAVAIGIAPKSEDAHYGRALLYYSLGKYNDAVADLDVVVQQAPKVAHVYLTRGNAHAEMGHTAAAMADYDKAIQSARNTADDDWIRAKVYYQQGNYSSAATLFARAKKRSPRDEAILNSAAWFKSTCPDGSFRNGREALEEIKKACELTKWEDAPQLDTLAAAYAEVGDFSEAIKYQTKALSLTSTMEKEAKQMQVRLRLYQNHKPFRDEPQLRQR